VVDVSVGIDVGPVVSLGIVVGAVVSVADVVRQLEPVMVFESKVTAPFCARARPFKNALVFKVIDSEARIFPINEVLVPSVAELPTCHHTLHGSSPVTDEPEAVVSVETARKIHTPDPDKVRFPLKEKLLSEQ
jgi:hypothetical protein